MSGGTKRRILFVGMADSPHAAGWIELIADNGWEMHFFPVTMVTPHPLMRGLTLLQPWITVRPRQWLLTLAGWLLGKAAEKQIAARRYQSAVPVRAIYPVPMLPRFGAIFGALKGKQLGESAQRAPLVLGPKTLARAIRTLKPDLIHSMEFQHAGYNVLRAKELMKGEHFPTWLATNWGSDIYYYRRFDDHRQQISRLLQSADYYSCECERDIVLAKELGMTAQVLPVLPNTGGFDIEAIAPLRAAMPPSQRRMVMVKGYQHFAGRALTALDALLACADNLRDYRIVLFSAGSPEVAQRVEELRLFHGMNISLLPYCDHEKMLRYFAHARIYLGVSISDAISTSMLEAMAMGAFPIQTNTACCEEWTHDGISGFHIPPDNVEVIADRLRRALANDIMVDAAAAHNWKTVCERLDYKLLKEKEMAFYETLFGSISSANISHVD
jgi:glycosyltransferase involved in cell wall biosynthesis